MPRSLLRPLRNVPTSLLSRPSRVWDGVTALAAAIATRRDAVTEVVEEAKRRRDLPLHRRLFMIRWAGDIAGGRTLRRGFRPAQHLRGDEARAAARRALSARIEADDDETAREQLIGLLDTGDLDQMLALISTDIRRRIADRAVQPKRGAGVDPSALVPIVADVTRRLEEHGIRPFLMSGTLLGFVRDGTFLEHDHDVDLGILPESGIDAVADALAGSGLTLSVELEDLWLLGVHPSGLKIDFFRHELRDGRFWHASRVHRWWNTPFTVSEFAAHGHRWWVPEDPERYLDENYGRWSDPVAFYDISFDTPNREYHPTTTAARQLYEACIRGLSSNDRWMVESAARELRDHFGVDVTQHLADSPLLRPNRGPAPT